MEPLPPLSAVRAFEAAGRLENFSRAAEELGMTQAAVSYQVRQLEDRLGRSLFVREKGRVRLSEAGHRLLPAVTAAFAGMADAFAALREEDHEVLAINAAISLGSVWLSGRIGRFQMRFPDLAVRLSLANETIDLGNSSFDVAIRAGSGVWEGLRSTFLFRQHFTPICTREFLEANAIARPEDLLRAERLAPNDAGWAGWFAAAGVEAKLAPRRGIVMDNQSQEASIVQESYGVALMSPLFWQAELESGRLIQPFETLYMPGSAHWLVHPVNRVGVRKIERLREWLLEELEAYRGVLPDRIFKPL